MTNNILESGLTSKECGEIYDMHYTTVNSRVRSYGVEGVDYRVGPNGKHDLIINKDFAEKVLSWGAPNTTLGSTKEKDIAPINTLDLVLTTKECADKYDMNHLTVNSRIRCYGVEGVDYRTSANNKHDLIILKSFADKILRLAEANSIESKAKVKPSYRINVEGRDFEI